MAVKNCFKCNKKKPLKDFYKHPQMPDGHVNKCKECNKKDVRENREARRDYYNHFDRERSKTPERKAAAKLKWEREKNDPICKERARQSRKEWIKKNEVKRAAHVLVGHAIKAGKLIPEKCEVCGKKKVDAHHDDYTKPLDVRWLCRKHHIEHHKKEREKVREKF